MIPALYPRSPSSSLAASSRESELFRKRRSAHRRAAARSSSEERTTTFKTAFIILSATLTLGRRMSFRHDLKPALAFRSLLGLPLFFALILDPDQLARFFIAESLAAAQITLAVGDAQKNVQRRRDFLGRTLFLVN
jgi:hypothetical protein